MKILEPKISVIVPVYKVEDYLDRCVNSIVNQTYQNIEIILVDDGSPDKCPEMCDVWAQKDDRIKVIHKTNGGISEARNVGLSNANGEYISFVDSDDWIDNFFYERLVSKLNSSGCDIVACRYLKVDSKEESCIDSNDSYNTRIIDNYEAMKDVISGDIVWQVIVNKIYKKELISNILFEVGKRHEDDMWTYQVVGLSHNIAIVDYVGYFYYQRKDSFMCDRYNLKRLDVLEAKTLRQQYIEEYYPDLSIPAKADLLGCCMFACQSVIRFMESEEKQKAKQVIIECVKKYSLTKQELALFSGKKRFWLNFACKNFFMCCKIRNLLRIGF